MTVLSVVQGAAPKIGIAVPSVLFSDTGRTAIELQEAVNEAASVMLDDFDWQQLKDIATVTGTGAVTEFSLPSNYKRMPKAANLRPSDEPNSPLNFFTDLDDWLAEEVSAVQTVTRRAIIYGDLLRIKPVLPVGVTVQYPYVKKHFAIAVGDTAASKAAFDTDTDTFVLDERALKLSLIWRWKAAKGRPYAEDQAAYEALIDSQASNSKGPRAIRVGRRRLAATRDAVPSYPWNIIP